MERPNFFRLGFREMLPIITGVIPFGAVVGTICAEANLTFFQANAMNLILYAGASQMAATDLMAKHAASVVVIVTGLIINLRFLLYSAAMSPVLHRSNFLTKFVCAFCLTDQSYAVMSANHDKLRNNADAIQFYLGTCACMFFFWNFSFAAGYIFGNFAPSSWALDYAVPLSFVALVIPTLKNKKYVAVAAFSSAVSVLLHPMPYRMGLLVTALLAIALGTFLSRPRGAA